MEKYNLSEEEKQKAIAEIINNFDFVKAHAIMEMLDITFPNGIRKSGRHIPTIEELKEDAKKTLEEAWKERVMWEGISEEDRITGLGDWCGHMMVDILEDSLELQFMPIISDYYFDSEEG